MENSTIKENPFEVVDPKVQKSIMNISCNPLLSFVSNGNVAHSQELGNSDLQSPKLTSSKKISSIRLLEELLVIGLSEDIKENLRNFPTHSPVEFRPKLTFSYPESEKS